MNLIKILMRIMMMMTRIRMKLWLMMMVQTIKGAEGDF